MSEHRLDGPQPEADPPPVEYRLLGPLDVSIHGRTVSLGGPTQRALLAVLLLSANQVVSAERLVLELWGDDPPPSAGKMVQLYVSRLRRILSPAGGSALLTRAPGYLLPVTEETFDLARFERGVAAATALRTTAPAASGKLLREVLALWRGEPLSDLRGEPFVAVAQARLDELRLNALEARVDADLASGLSGELVGELVDLVSRYPLRERFHGQLMLAYYRSGRQSDALDAFRRARAALVDAFGVEPGPELRRLEEEILRHEPALDLTSSSRSVTVGSPATARTDDSDAVLSAATPLRRRRRLAFALVALIVAAVTGAAILGDRGSSPVKVLRNSLAVLNPMTGHLVADVSVGTDPGPLAASSGAVWVVDTGDRTLLRIDDRSRRVANTWGLPASASSLVAGDGYVWVVDGFNGTVSRVLTAANQMAAPTFPSGDVPGLVALAPVGNDIWAGLGNGTLVDLTAGSLRLKQLVHTGSRAYALAADAQRVWLVPFTGDFVRPVDVATGRLGAPIGLPDPPDAIATGGGAVWVATSGDDILWEIDTRTLSVVRSVPLGIPAADITVADGSVWVTGAQTRELERIDARTGDLQQALTLPRPIAAVTAAGGRLWVSVD